MSVRADPAGKALLILQPLFSSLQLNGYRGWSPPQPPMRLMTPTGRLASVGACRTPTTPSSKFAALPKGCVERSRMVSEECSLREPAVNHGFTVSVFFAIAITAMFAFVFGAPQELVATLLVLGLLTALAEYVLRFSSERKP
jgi:hypothetical protein